MPRSGPRQIHKYSKEFKLAAVRLRHVPGMQVKAVATALGIHPFMLSKWRKDVLDGTIRGRLPKAATPGPAREIARLQQLERAHAVQDRTLLEQIRDLAPVWLTPPPNEAPAATAPPASKPQAPSGDTPAVLGVS